MFNENSVNNVKCTFSLAQALQQAGGSISQNVLDMSVGNFIVNVAGPNDIFFHHCPTLTKNAPTCAACGIMMAPTIIGNCWICLNCGEKSGRS